MKVKILIIAFLCAHFVGFSQWRKAEKLEKDKAPNLKLSYLSRINFNNPGVNLGAEFMVQRKAVTIKNFTRTKEKFITANLSIFDEPNLNSNIAFHLEWLKRTSYGNSGFFTEAAIGFGVGKGINYVAPPTYVKNADGSESIKKPQTNFIILPITLGLGYDFKPKTNMPIKVFARGGIYPIYYHVFVFNNFLKSEIGVITSLSIFKRK
jgi:hypothetical protein